MDSAQWNERLFAELVLNVGSPGDPLFLHADDDVLAKCSVEAMSPAAARNDFCRAFNSEGSEARFKRPSRLAREWKNSSYLGPPPFLDALVMTVLAATLPAIGTSAANIHGRQRQLLGLRDTAAGIPPGYEIYVPVLWAAWNTLLEGDGAGYGTPTAKTSAHWSNQGWARSQFFIRSRDKEDIYDYFSEARLGGTQTEETNAPKLGAPSSVSEPQHRLVLAKPVLDSPPAPETTKCSRESSGAFQFQAVLRTVLRTPLSSG